MWKNWLGIVLFIVAIPLLPFAIWGELPGGSWVDHPSGFYVFLLGVAVLSSDIFLPIPSSVVAVFLGARLGTAAGSLAIALGMSVGAMIGFGVGWYLGYPAVRRYTSPEQVRLVKDLERRFGYISLATVRAVPVLAEASVLTAGAARFNPYRALSTLFVANCGLALLYAGLGSAGEHKSSPAWLFAGSMGVPALAVLLFFLVRRALCAHGAQNPRGSRTFRTHPHSWSTRR